MFTYFVVLCRVADVLRTYFVWRCQNRGPETSSDVPVSPHSIRSRRTARHHPLSSSSIAPTPPAPPTPPRPVRPSTQSDSARPPAAPDTAHAGPIQLRRRTIAQARRIQRRRTIAQATSDPATPSVPSRPRPPLADRRQHHGAAERSSARGPMTRATADAARARDRGAAVVVGAVAVSRIESSRAAKRRRLLPPSPRPADGRAVAQPHASLRAPPHAQHNTAARPPAPIKTGPEIRQPIDQTGSKGSPVLSTRSSCEVVRPPHGRFVGRANGRYGECDSARGAWRRLTCQRRFRGAGKLRGAEFSDSSGCFLFFFRV